MNKLSLFQTTETRQLSAAVRRDPQQQEADDHHRATTQRWVSQHGDGIWPHIGQIGSKWDKSGNLSDQISVEFGLSNKCRRVNRPAIAGRLAKRNQLGMLFLLLRSKFSHLACFTSNLFTRLNCTEI